VAEWLKAALAKEVSQCMMTKPWQARSLTGGPQCLPNILKSKNAIIFRDVAALSSHCFEQTSQRRKKAEWFYLRGFSFPFRRP